MAGVFQFQPTKEPPEGLFREHLAGASGAVVTLAREGKCHVALATNEIFLGDGQRDRPLFEKRCARLGRSTKV